MDSRHWNSAPAIWIYWRKPTTICEFMRTHSNIIFLAECLLHRWHICFDVTSHLLGFWLDIEVHLSRVVSAFQSLFMTYTVKSRSECRVFPRVRLLHLIQLYVETTFKHSRRHSSICKRRVLNGSKNSYDCTGGEIVVISHNPCRSVSLEQKETLQWNSSLCSRVQRTTYNWVALWKLWRGRGMHTSTLICVVENRLIFFILILDCKKCLDSLSGFFFLRSFLLQKKTFTKISLLQNTSTEIVLKYV